MIRRIRTCSPCRSPRWPAPRSARSARRHTREERRRDPDPDPGEAHRRGALRGAQAEPRRGLQEDRPADQRARLPPREGACPGHRPAGGPRRRPRRGDQRRAPQGVRRGAAEQRPVAGGPAGDRDHQVRGQHHPRVQRRGGRPAEPDPPVVRRSGGQRRAVPRGRRGRHRADRLPAGALRHPARRGAGRGRRRLRDHRPGGDRGRPGRPGCGHEGHQLPGRPGGHGRRAGRGPGRDGCRRLEDLRARPWWAATRSATRSRSR